MTSSVPSSTSAISFSSTGPDPSCGIDAVEAENANELVDELPVSVQVSSRLQWSDSSPQVISVFRRMAPLPEHAPFAHLKDDDDEDEDSDKDEQPEGHMNGRLEQGAHWHENESDIENDSGSEGINDNSVVHETSRRPNVEDQWRGSTISSSNSSPPRVRLGDQFQAQIPTLLTAEEKAVERERRVLQGRIDPTASQTVSHTLLGAQPWPRLNQQTHQLSSSSSSSLGGSVSPQHGAGLPSYGAYELIGFFRQAPNVAGIDSHTFSYHKQKSFLITKYKRHRPQNEQKECSKNETPANEYEHESHKQAMRKMRRDANATKGTALRRTDEDEKHAEGGQANGGLESSSQQHKESSASAEFTDLAEGTADADSEDEEADDSPGEFESDAKQSTGGAVDENENAMEQ